MSVPTVCTVLMPAERARVEAAGSGYFHAAHAESLPAVLRTVRGRHVDAVLLSVHRCDRAALGDIVTLVREFPAIPTVALVSRYDPRASTALLQLGATGVRDVVDLTAPAGWSRLRDVIAHPASPVVARILAGVLPRIAEAPAGSRLFFEAAARLAPAVSTVRALCRHFGVPASTVMSRFFRAGLPSPKVYLSELRLLHAAHLFETPGLSVADVAYRLDYSSPQSFGRHLKTTRGMTATEFRSRFPFDTALSQFVNAMVEPYREVLCRFHPLNIGALDHGRDAVERPALPPVVRASGDVSSWSRPVVRMGDRASRRASLPPRSAK
jgi:AraC-like DNA-binding protein